MLTFILENKIEIALCAIATFSILIIISFPVDAALGKGAELSLTLNPNITQIITNNYTSYGGFIPIAPWLYNLTGNLYYNYSRLYQEFPNRTDVTALLQAQDECSEISGCVVGAITTSFNSTYAATSADVSANRSAWLTNCFNSTYESNYNSTYAATSADVTANRTDWLTKCFNSTYESTYNVTYASTSADVTANRSSWLTNCYNSTYENTFNSTYDNYWKLNYTNNSLYWNGLLSPLSAWTNTFNQSYHDFLVSNRSSTSNSSSYWDNLDSPLSTWLDTYNVSYHGIFASNRTGTSNSSGYWGNYLVSSGACSNVCTDSADNTTWNETKASGLYIHADNASVPTWANQTAIAITGNTVLNTTAPANISGFIINATGIYFNGTMKSITWNATHMILRNLGA